MSKGKTKAKSTSLHKKPAPSLLLLYHIEKTGGSSVFRWLQRQMREPPRLSALFAYGQTSSGKTFTITFKNGLGTQNVPLLVADGSGLTGPGASVLVKVAREGRAANPTGDDGRLTIAEGTRLGLDKTPEFKDKQREKPYVDLHRAGTNLRGLIRILLCGIAF